MKKNGSLAILSLVSLFAFGCSSPSVSQSTNTPQKVTNLTINQQQLTFENNRYVAKISSNKGAELPVTINFKSGLQTKAVNVDGKPAVQESDIAKVDVYLLKLASGFSGTNPLGVANANVVTSFTNLAKTASVSTFNITFKNVPGLASPNQYWIAVVVKDSSGNVLSATPATPWTADTFTTTPALALSSSGVGVDTTTLAVSTTTALSVAVKLVGVVGAQITADADITPGVSTITDSDITVQ